MSKQLNPGEISSKRSIFSGVRLIPEITIRGVLSAQSAFKGKVKQLFGMFSDEEAIVQYANSQTSRETNSHGGISKAIKRIKKSSFYAPASDSVAPYGYFHGRAIIGDCTSVIGGIYLSHEPQEAIVVDEKYGLLFGAFIEFRDMYIAPLKSEKISEGILLDQVLCAVKGAYEWNKEKVQELNFKNNIQPDQRVALDIYLSAGLGVARHHVLTAAYLIQRLQQEGWLTGCLSIDTTVVDERLMYTARTGDIYIMDFSKGSIEVGH